MGDKSIKIKLNIRNILAILVVFTLVSCTQLKLITNNSVFYEFDRRLHETNEGYRVEYLENHGEKYYYYIETTLKNLSHDSILIDLSSIKFKIGDNSIDMGICYDYKSISKEKEYFVIPSDTTIELIFDGWSNDGYIKLENMFMYQDIFNGWENYISKLNDIAELEFTYLSENEEEDKISIRVKNFKGITTEKEFNNFKNKCLQSSKNKE